MKRELYYIHYKDSFSSYKINKKLSHLISSIDKSYNKIVFLCIGSDRATGDCFGPLVGEMLSRSKIYDFELYGTLDNPIHATNLKDVLNNIDKKSSLIIGIDSCLGKSQNIGYISVGYGGLRPGSGVGKDLPEVGDIHIAGIVNIAGFMPNILLQCTPLSTVYRMAEIAASSIRLTLYQQEKARFF